MRTIRMLGFMTASLIVSTALIHGQETFVTTIQIFPSPEKVLEKLERTTRLKTIHPRTRTNNPSTIAGTLPPPLLKECGFRTFWQESVGSVKSPINIQVYEMDDPSGAYSVFTTLAQAGGEAKSIGEGSLAKSDDLWIWQSNLLVHLTYSGARRGGDLQLERVGKEISTLIHQRAGVPNLAKQMPDADRVPGSLQYVLGPEGFQDLGLPLNMAKLGLEMGAEAATAQYQLAQSSARLVLISYPTPQMARKFYTGIQNSQDLLMNRNPGEQILVKRSGPLIAILFGSFGKAQAESILNKIQYTANLTWDQVPPEEELRAYFHTIMGGIMLTGSILLFTVGTGVVFGLLRLAVKRWVPIHIFDRPEDVEIIQLGLTGKSYPSSPNTGRS